MPTKKEQFYKKYYQTVADSVKGTGLHPEFVIAQMGLESNWGTSGLSSKYNNFFGIKGKGANMQTEEVVDGKRVKRNADFRTYDSVEDSIKDYIKVLKTQGGGKTYAKVFNAKTPEEQAEAIGNTPYATATDYGASIENTIKSTRKQNLIPNNMPEQDKKAPGKKESWKKFPSVYEDKIKKLNYYAKKYGKDSIVFKHEKERLDKQVMAYVWKKQQIKEKALEDGIKKAEEDGDWTKAGNLLTAQEMFNDEKIEFNKMKGGEKGASSRDWDDIYEGVSGSRMPDVDMTKLYETFDRDYWKQGAKEWEESNQAETEQQDPTAVPLSDVDDGSGSSSASQSASSSATGGTSGGTDGIVDDLGLTGDESKDYAGAMETAKKKRDEAYAMLNEQDEFQFEYGPDNQSNLGDTLGNLVDVGRGVMGMIAANEDVPEYERGRMFSTAMDEAERMRTMGLSADEIAMRERGLMESAAYGMKNVARGAGGSAGSYLANVGTITGQLMKGKGEIAAMDEAVRRSNRQNFQNMALRDEAVNRQIFEDDLNQVLRNKQAGAGLVQDALSNIKERADYNKMYGKDSIYGQYMRDLSRDAQSNAFYREQQAKNTMRKYVSDADADYQKAVEEYEKANTLTADPKNTEEVIKKNAVPSAVTMEEVTMDQPTDALGRKSIFKKGSQAVSNQKLGSNLSPEEEAMNKKIAEQGKTKKQRADEIEKLMMETDDEDELMRLDAEYSKLKL